MSRLRNTEKGILIKHFQFERNFSFLTDFDKRFVYRHIIIGNNIGL